jgi:hypothetical protein
VEESVADQLLRRREEFAGIDEIGRHTVTFVETVHKGGQYRVSLCVASEVEAVNERDPDRAGISHHGAHAAFEARVILQHRHPDDALSLFRALDQTGHGGACAACAKDRVVPTPRYPSVDECGSLHPCSSGSAFGNHEITGMEIGCAVFSDRLRRLSIALSVHELERHSISFGVCEGGGLDMRPLTPDHPDAFQSGGCRGEGGGVDVVRIRPAEGQNPFKAASQGL